MKYLINIILAILIVIVTISLSTQLEKMVIILDTANANLRIDELLTLASRNYIITGNTKYRDKYFLYSTVRDGSGEWDILLKFPWFKGKTLTMDELYEQLELNENDLKPINKAHQESIQLMWTEIVAMNMYEGFIDENEEAKRVFDNQPLPKKYIQFKKKVDDVEELEKMRQESIDMIYSEDYMDIENTIAVLSQKGVELVLIRQQNIINTYTTAFYILILLFLAYNVYMTYTGYTNTPNKTIQVYPTASAFKRTSQPYYI